MVIYLTWASTRGPVFEPPLLELASFFPQQHLDYELSFHEPSLGSVKQKSWLSAGEKNTISFDHIVHWGDSLRGEDINPANSLIPKPYYSLINIKTATPTNKGAAVNLLPLKALYGTPGTTRTYDLRIRSPSTPLLLTSH